MTQANQLEPNLISESLEDYLETIYHLVRDKKVARVKDIAKARDVSMASVSTAMRRLADLNLIHYTQREFIELTPEGEEAVRKVIVRHEILRQFLQDFLGIDAAIADTDACQIEHHLSDSTVDRFVRLLEFLANCPDGKKALELFRSCQEVNADLESCRQICEGRMRWRWRGGEAELTTLGDLTPGRHARVAKINARGALRQRLIDMGMLPLTEVEVERVAPSGDPIWIRIRGFNLSLRKEEAQGIVVTPI
ncbi:MAG: DtxR family transcriptional regulator [Myxococcales bacterium]|nr:DtxR family transcriptional regulator [Myxococcales bacterium]